jgi:hypothetical protein
MYWEGFEPSQVEMSPDGMRRNKRGRRSSHVMSVCVCGLDVHKESTYATILTPEGKIVLELCRFGKGTKHITKGKLKKMKK